jgi:hypothetical protein
MVSTYDSLFSLLGMLHAHTVSLAECGLSILLCLPPCGVALIARGDSMMADQ